MDWQEHRERKGGGSYIKRCLRAGWIVPVTSKMIEERKMDESRIIDIQAEEQLYLMSSVWDILGSNFLRVIAIRTFGRLHIRV